MKVLVFNGSPHAEGALHRGLQALCGELQRAGIDSEIVHVGDKQIRGCVDCRACRKLGRCVFNDDMVNECGEKLAAACGVVLGSPVYYGGVAGTFKCFLDRLFFSQADLRGKAGAVAVSLRRSGGISTFHQLNNYLNLAQAVLTPSLYWDVFHGNNADEAGEDAEGMHIMETTGRNMAWLIKSLAEAKKSIPLPESKPRIMTNFIR